jgi:ribosomal protein L11 methyltransferase
VAQSWLQLSIRTGAASIDALSNVVIERGSPGVVLKRDGLDAFFPTSRDNAALRREIRRSVVRVARLNSRAASPRLQWKFIKPENWEQSWKRFIKPRRVGKSFWVTPPWLEPPKFRRRRVIVMDPGMAFGTGTHATTRGCMEFLEVVAHKLAGKKFTALDVGTGSGILSIALALLGATEIWAIDNDPVAVKVAGENLRANRVAERICLSEKKLVAIRRTFTVVVANLTAETMVELADALKKRVTPAGYLVLSGILYQQAAAVVRRFAENFRLIERRRKREWVTLLLRRKA